MGIGTPLADPNRGNSPLCHWPLIRQVVSAPVIWIFFSGLPAKLRMSYWSRMGTRTHRHDYRLMNSGSAVAGRSSVTGRGAGSSGSQPRLDMSGASGQGGTGVNMDSPLMASPSYGPADGWDCMSEGNRYSGLYMQAEWCGGVELSWWPWGCRGGGQGSVGLWISWRPVEETGVYWVSNQGVCSGHQNGVSGHYVWHCEDGHGGDPRACAGHPTGDGWVGDKGGNFAERVAEAAGKAALCV